jgi:hypothetical protein
MLVRQNYIYAGGLVLVMTDGKKDAVPSRIEPFEAAIEDVRLKKSKIYFGAPRGEGRSRHTHDGIDLGVAVGTPIQVPAQKAVLIGSCRESSAAGASLGNALMFFVPHEKEPYFLVMAHLSSRTFGLLRRSGIKFGREITDRPGGAVVAYAGASRAGPWPHVHASAMTSFQFGGRAYTAAAFMDMYRDDAIPRTNFYALKPPARYRNSMSLTGYLDPIGLIDKGMLRFATKPAPQLVAERKEKEKPAMLALR